MRYEKPRIDRILDPEPRELLDFTTIFTRMQKLKIPLWREFLQVSAELHETGEIQAIDGTSMDRVAASQHYVKRTDYTTKAVKTASLINCHTDKVLDIYW